MEPRPKSPDRVKPPPGFLFVLFVLTRANGLGRQKCRSSLTTWIAIPGPPLAARRRSLAICASVPTARRDAARQCGRGSKAEYVVASDLAPVRFRPSAPNHSACASVCCGLGRPCTSTALALPCKQEICVRFTARAPDSPLSFNGQDAALRTRRWTFNSSRRRQPSQSRGMRRSRQIAGAESKLAAAGEAVSVTESL